MKGIITTARYLVGQFFQLVIASILGLVFVPVTKPPFKMACYIIKQRAKIPSPIGQVVFRDPLSIQIDAE